MRSPDFCIYENKGTDQLCSDSTADQHLCFCYMDSTVPPLLSTYAQNFKVLGFFCCCTGRFVSEVVRNPEDRFSCDTTHRISVHWPSGRMSSQRMRGQKFDTQLGHVVSMSKTHSLTLVVVNTQKAFA